MQKVTNKQIVLAYINDIYKEMQVSEDHSIDFVKGFHEACDKIYKTVLEKGSDI